MDATRGFAFAFGIILFSKSVLAQNVTQSFCLDGSTPKKSITCTGGDVPVTGDIVLGYTSDCSNSSSTFICGKPLSKGLQAMLCTKPDGNSVCTLEDLKYLPHSASCTSTLPKAASTSYTCSDPETAPTTGSFCLSGTTPLENTTCTGGAVPVTGGIVLGYMSDCSNSSSTFICGKPISPALSAMFCAKPGSGNSICTLEDLKAFPFSASCTSALPKAASTSYICRDPPTAPTTVTSTGATITTSTAAATPPVRAPTTGSSITKSFCLDGSTPEKNHTCTDGDRPVTGGIVLGYMRDCSNSSTFTCGRALSPALQAKFCAKPSGNSICTAEELKNLPFSASCTSTLPKAASTSYTCRDPLTAPTTNTPVTTKATLPTSTLTSITDAFCLDGSTPKKTVTCFNGRHPSIRKIMLGYMEDCSNSSTFFYGRAMPVNLQKMLCSRIDGASTCSPATHKLMPQVASLTSWFPKAAKVIYSCMRSYR